MAFSAVKASPVIASCVARVAPKDRVSKNKPPASGANPTPTKAWINLDLSDAIQKSTAKAILAAAPATAPSTSMITGLGICLIL